MDALNILRHAAARFPDGMLGQEREALTMEAMAQAGQHTAAFEGAEQFLRAQLWSPHADRVRQAVRR